MSLLSNEKKNANGKINDKIRDLSQNDISQKSNHSMLLIYTLFGILAPVMLCAPPSVP